MVMQSTDKNAEMLERYKERVARQTHAHSTSSRSADTARTCGMWTASGIWISPVESR
jgi:hypothetical protein